MTDIRTNVKEDQVEARKSGERLKAKLLTTLLGEFDRLPDKNNKSAYTKVVQKMIKNLKESHSDTAEEEIKFLELYLPQQLTVEQIKDTLSSNNIDTMSAAGKFFKQYCVEEQCIVDMALVRQVLETK